LGFIARTLILTAGIEFVNALISSNFSFGIVLVSTISPVSALYAMDGVPQEVSSETLSK